MKTFSVKTRWRTYNNCVLFMDRYAINSHIVLRIFTDEGPLASLTVNLPETRRYPNNFGFLDVNNFPEAETVVNSLGIGKETGILAASGFCVYPLYEFDIEKIKEMI